MDSTANAVNPTPVDVATRGHHKRGPSKLGYINQCSAYTGRNETSEASEAGTFLHELMRMMLEQVVAKEV